jgi:hypothetical protein
MQQSYFNSLLWIRREAPDLATVFGCIIHSLHSANERDESVREQRWNTDRFTTLRTHSKYARLRKPCLRYVNFLILSYIFLNSHKLSNL